MSASRVELAAIAALLLFGGVLIALDWPATLTDEDDYMPYALADLVHGRNPYATVHTETRTVHRPWADQTYSWTTALPYFPLIAFLQLPGIDYRWTALLSYGALLLALRGKRVGFWAFANPLVAWLAASGFNDFAPLALVAWSARSALPWLAWLAAASKQFFLPLLAVDAFLRREWRVFVGSALFTLAVCVPFLLLDPGAFVRSAFLDHAAKAPRLFVFVNYALYPLYAATVMWPARAAARDALIARNAQGE